MTRTVLLAGMLLAANANAQLSGTASITFAVRPCTCTISSLSDLDFGNWHRPRTNGASVTVFYSGGHTYSGFAADDQAATHSTGSAGITAANCAGYTLGRTFPSSLGALTFSQGKWGWSTSTSNPSEIGLSTHSQSNLGGEGSSVTRYYFFGGTVSGINANQASAVYSGTLSLTATCS